MGLGYQKSQRHAASDRRVFARLALHAAWMKKFQDQGMSRDDASAEAMKRVLAGNLPCDIQEGGGAHYGDDLRTCKICGMEKYSESFQCPHSTSPLSHRGAA